MKIELGNCNFGVANVPAGAVFNFQDVETKILVQVPFGQDHVPNLIKAVVESGCLTESQKRELAPLFNGGIFLPGEDFKEGPQG